MLHGKIRFCDRCRQSIPAAAGFARGPSGEDFCLACAGQGGLAPEPGAVPGVPSPVPDAAQGLLPVSGVSPPAQGVPPATGITTPGPESRKRRLYLIAGGSALGLVFLVAVLWLIFGGGGDQKPAEKSRFLKELRKPSYPKARAPKVPPLLRWDFSGDRVCRYGFDMRINNISYSNLGGLARKRESFSIKGKMLVRSQGDRTAKLVLQNFQKTVRAAGAPADPEAWPTITISGMREDSAPNPGGALPELLLEKLFPLPPKALRVGESSTSPASMPFGVAGSLFEVKGRTRTTLKGYVRIGDRTCARLDTAIDISRLDIPPEKEGEYSCSVRGASVFYFDVEDRRFVSGKVALLIVFDVDAPFPIKITGEGMPKLPERLQMGAKCDSLIRITSGD